MELIKLLPATDEIDDIAKVPAVLFPDNMALQLESSYVNREHLLHGYLLKEAGKTLGGIAFYNNPGHYLEGEKACCVGYFHCINDVAAAKLLIDTVKKDNWPAERHDLGELPLPHLRFTAGLFP
jgi:hypothetical protein